MAPSSHSKYSLILLHIYHLKIFLLSFPVPPFIQTLIILLIFSLKQFSPRDLCGSYKLQHATFLRISLMPSFVLSSATHLDPQGSKLGFQFLPSYSYKLIKSLMFFRTNCLNTNQFYMYFSLDCIAGRARLCFMPRIYQYSALVDFKGKYICKVAYFLLAYAVSFSSNYQVNLYSSKTYLIFVT